MRKYKKFGLIVLVLCCCIGCDQVTKDIAKETLSHADAISICHDMFRLQYAENTGAFLSLGSELPHQVRFWIFVVFPGIVLGLIFFFILISSSIHSRELIGLSLFLGGGVSNLFDRINHSGKVIDFINIGIGSVRTGVFNIADVAIMIGTGLLLLSLLRVCAP